MAYPPKSLKTWLARRRRATRAGGTPLFILLLYSLLFMTISTCYFETDSGSPARHGGEPMYNASRQGVPPSNRSSLSERATSSPSSGSFSRPKSPLVRRDLLKSIFRIIDPPTMPMITGFYFITAIGFEHIGSGGGSDNVMAC